MFYVGLDSSRSLDIGTLQCYTSIFDGCIYCIVIRFVLANWILCVVHKIHKEIQYTHKYNIYTHIYNHQTMGGSVGILNYESVEINMKWLEIVNVSR